METDAIFTDLLNAPPPAYLVLDTESVPDGRLLNLVRYADESLTPEEGVSRAQSEARAGSSKGSDFLPVTFQVPVAACVLRVGLDYGLQHVACLDAPAYRPRQITEQFWQTAHQVHERFGDRATWITFNGRGFDLPLLQMAAFRYGIAAPHLLGPQRPAGWQLDLMDWLSGCGDFRMAGGLNLLSKLLGKPGKRQVRGEMIYPLFRDGKLQEINDYCLFDTLDTYFVFLRTRVLTGDLTLDEEHAAVVRARAWLEARTESLPGLKDYLANWGDWSPWP